MTLDRRITLYQPTTSQNSSGQVKRSFASAGDFYAQEVIPQTGTVGSEIFVNDQMQSQYMITWRMRYQTAVSADWKIGFGGKYYDIIAVTPEGRKRYILVKTKQRDNGIL
jgi:SPP1 family predicted phage head-tail adaptor